MTDVTGSRAFSYGSDLQVQQEQFTGGFYGTSRAMTYVYETSGVIGRLNGVDLGTTGNPTADQVTSYGFQADGRVASIAGHGAGFTNYSFAYGYTANADLLIASVTNAASGFAQNRTYDSFRNLVTNVTTAYGATTKAQFDYTYNNLGQRLTAAQSGEVFGDYGASPQVQYGYDGRGQLTAAAYSLGGVAMPGRQYGYAYDSGGNRTSANHTGNATFAEDYTANVLNQITEHENTVIPVQGTAVAGANVVVQNTTRAGRAGNYWGTEALLNNATGPVQGSIPILAGLPGSPDQVTTPVTKTAFQAAFNESLGYDNDGNLSADGRWSYTWDAENRLTSMETTVAAIAAGLPDMLVQFRYDYQGRRVKKTVTVNGTQQSERRYVYNGWNLAAELDGAGSVQRHFIWGLDLTGTIGGAGGVGGLLMIQDGGSSYLPAYDGGGNIVALLSAADGYDAAIYEYSPFGEQLRGEGLYAASNPFRFSTKFTDTETGLVYYGFRYYQPGLGRWLGRDPIEEKGGLNLYGFVRNNPVNSWDLLGMWPVVSIVINGGTTAAGNGRYASGGFGTAGSLGITIDLGKIGSLRSYQFFLSGQRFSGGENSLLDGLVMGISVSIGFKTELPKTSIQNFIDGQSFGEVTGSAHDELSITGLEGISISTDTAPGDSSISKSFGFDFGAGAYSLVGAEAVNRTLTISLDEIVGFHSLGAGGSWAPTPYTPASLNVLSGATNPLNIAPNTFTDYVEPGIVRMDPVVVNANRGDPKGNGTGRNAHDKGNNASSEGSDAMKVAGAVVIDIARMNAADLDALAAASDYQAHENEMKAWADLKRAIGSRQRQ